MTPSERAWQISSARFPTDAAKRRKAYHAILARLGKSADR